MPLSAIFLFLVSQSDIFKPSEIVQDAIRVQVITPNLVRIEAKGPEGFEDRHTFTVVARPSDFTKIQGNEIDEPGFKVIVPDRARPQDVQILDGAGSSLYQWDGTPVKHSFLPSPSSKFKTYVIEDTPRIVPPEWGATAPPPSNTHLRATSGWDLGNDAPDLYVFVRGDQGYTGVRKDFLDLTGHTPMPPLAAFGLWDSRYYEYKQQEALDTIDAYHKHGFPLDFFVVDTDWRVNGSHGYAVATNDFPDMRKFIGDAHAKHVELMFNDHPEPVAQGALDPKELAYREKGVDELLDWGADVWWYDRNWSTHLHEPAPGIAPEVWGGMLYHDMTAKAHPDSRPMMMSNVQGIDNGKRDYAPHPAFHRYPIWWTGDTGAYFSYLNWGVENGVDEGVLGLLPYVNEDLGGHWAHPTPELFVRYLQYGTLSPITRLHCTKGEDRHPWTFGKEAEDIVRNYVKMRYRLIPTLYAAAHQAYEDGTPLLRRCDLYWPDYPEAASNTQFLLGDSILAAPTLESTVADTKVVSGSLLHTDSGEPGLLGEYFPNTKLQGKPVLQKVDPVIDFDWGAKAPVDGMPAENFSIRWTGKLGPAPETGDYQVAVRMDDGCRLFIDGKSIIDDWNPHAEFTETRTIHLDAGKTYPIRLEYLQLGNDDLCHLQWSLPSERRSIAERTLWIPPGEWEDLWTGERVTGPKTITVPSPLWHEALYARVGGVVLQAPEMDYTGEKPWDPVTVDVYAGKIDSTLQGSAELYEDDGKTNAYLNGNFRTTKVSFTQSGTLDLDMAAADGSDPEGPIVRAWVVRFHLPPGSKVAGVTDTLTEIPYKVLSPAPGHVSMPLLGAGSRPGGMAGPVVEVRLPPQEVNRQRQITVAVLP